LAIVVKNLCKARMKNLYLATLKLIGMDINMDIITRTTAVT